MKHQHNMAKRITITFLTGNKSKIRSASRVFSKYPQIKLKTLKTHTVEIQSLDVEEVAKYAAWEAANRLGIPVFKMDAGYYFEALNGFPGAFIKYFNAALSPEDILKLLEGKSRKVVVKEALAYCEPGKHPVVFTAQVTAKIGTKPMGQGSSIDRLIIYEGFNKPQAACDKDKIIEYWNKHLDHYERFARWLVGEKSKMQRHKKLI